MSYAFLLKYIIIGDSGTSLFIQELESHVSSSNTPTNATDKNIKSPLESSLEQNFLKSMITISNCKFGIL